MRTTLEWATLLVAGRPPRRKGTLRGPGPPAHFRPNRALGAGAWLPGRDGGVLPDGRRRFSGQAARPGRRRGGAALAPYFTAAGRTYPAFVSLVLVLPLLAAVKSGLPRTVRAGALLVLLGAVFAVLSLPAALTPSSWAGAQHFINYAAALGYVLGLIAFWFSGLIASPPGNTQATLRQKCG